MRKSITTIVLLATVATLASCGTPGPRGPSNKAIERALTGAPGEAQPSTIVSTEIAFARAAREEGQWTAFQEYAASGAVIHGVNGVIEAAPWLAAQEDPDEPVQWGARTVVMSCDGGTAVSQGRFRDPEGVVGNFVTVWERQPDRTYRFVYDVGAPDVPQPPPRQQVEDGDIIVTAIDAVEGLIATCPRTGEPTPPPPLTRPNIRATASEVKVSRDGTLRWRWEQRSDGMRYVKVEYYYLGEWTTALEETLAPGA